MNKEVRIVVVGEEGVGKSTLITSLIKEDFVTNVQSILPEVTIPPEMTVDHITTHIIDTTANKDYQSQLDHELRKGDVICLCYSILDRSSFLAIPEKWLPMFRLLNLKCPILLVGTKSDLKTNQIPLVSLEEDVVPLMTSYKNIETCLECSAKTLLNVSELFYFGQKAVLYPINPLFDSVDKVLKLKCISALKRIFELSDLNKDGILDDDELNYFQKKCFGSPLQLDELQSVKQVIGQHEPNGITDKGLTGLGFLFLHGLFLKRGRVETTWSVLRKFGYNDQLELDKDFIQPKMDVPSDCTVELSPNGYQFLADIFKAYDKDNDGALNGNELQELFSLCPNNIGNPWIHTEFPDTTVTNSTNSVTLQGFLAQWSLTTMQDYHTTLAYLAYLGYDGCSVDGVKLVRPNQLASFRAKRNHHHPRSTFTCYVVGGAGSGKTSILRSFVNKSFSSEYKPTTKPFSVVNAVDIHGAEKYLVLEELGANYEAAVLLNKRKLQQCDLVCLTYDASDPNSFLHVMHLREQYELDHLPYVIVATKSDLESVRQRMDDQPEVYCKKLGIAMPVKISVKNGDLSRLFNLFASVAMNPTGSIPGLNDKRRQSNSTLIYQYFKYSIYASLTLTSIYFLSKSIRHLLPNSFFKFGWIGLR